MANPAVKKGYIPLANEIYKAWMRTGPLEERVFKAVVWECWGYSDRRDAKEPVAISRGQIAKWTGINHKPTISRLMTLLVAKKKILRFGGGTLLTAKYLPNQDYSQWIEIESDSHESETSPTFTPSHENTTTTSRNIATPPSHENATPKGGDTLYSTKKSIKEDIKEDFNKSRGRLLKRYESLKPGRIESKDIDRLDMWVEDYGEDAVFEAISIACEEHRSNPDAFIGSVLRNRKKENSENARSGRRPCPPGFVIYRDTWDGVEYYVDKDHLPLIQGMCDRNVRKQILTDGPKPWGIPVNVEVEN